MTKIIFLALLCFCAPCRAFDIGSLLNSPIAQSIAGDAAKELLKPKESKGVEGDLLGDPVAGTYAQSVANRLMAQQPKVALVSVDLYRTPLVQSQVWMWTYVQVSRGMLNSILCEAEFACLLGHELGHITQGEHKNENEHVTSDLMNQAASATNKLPLVDLASEARGYESSHFSKLEEQRADEFGASLAAKAGYDPYTMADLFERLSQKAEQGLVVNLKKLRADHYRLADRAIHIREFLKAQGFKPGEGMRGYAEYAEGLSSLVTTRQPDGAGEQASRTARETRKQMVEEIDGFEKEARAQKQSGRPFSHERFLDIADRLSRFACRNASLPKIRPSALPPVPAKPQFMDEEMYQETPLWDLLSAEAKAEQEFLDKILFTLKIVGEAGVGTTLVLLDPADLYEQESGREFLTCRKLHHPHHPKH